MDTGERPQVSQCNAESRKQDTCLQLPCLHGTVAAQVLRYHQHRQTAAHPRLQPLACLQLSPTFWLWLRLLLIGCVSLCRGSVYLHKDRDLPMAAGPIWDLNEAFGQCCGYPIEGWQQQGVSGPGALPHLKGCFEAAWQSSWQSSWQRRQAKPEVLAVPCSACMP